ncbi:MAG: Nucleotidyltransferase domain protein [Candidatus Bathyarchaeota archaeon BA2]|nr:MAG: Nucleotidyltransferase domain protein [Candidatus Bathyarchaeota archaeon BA2]
MFVVAVAYVKTIAQFKDRLVKEFEDWIESIVLYGSVAKNKTHRNSDIDILLVTRDNDKRLYDKISKIRTKIDLENNTLTSLVHMSSEELERYIKLGSPFVKSVAEEGVILYDSGIFKKFRESLVIKG